MFTCEVTFFTLYRIWNRTIRGATLPYPTNIYIMFFFFLTRICFPASGQQAVVIGIAPSPPRFLPSIFIAHRVQQSHCASTFHRVLLTHALALSASQFVHNKKPPRIHTSCMHSGGFELMKLTHTRLEDNLMRHRGDRLYTPSPAVYLSHAPLFAIVLQQCSTPIYTRYQVPTRPEA